MTQEFMIQEFTILVSASPLKTQSHLTAMRFIHELSEQNITIRSVFFYQDAVLVANSFTAPPSDEPQIRDEWLKLSESCSFELQTCISAGFRRGILDDNEAKERGFEQGNLHDNLQSPLQNSSQNGFKITGLGQLAAAMSDKNVKLVHFK